MCGRVGIVNLHGLWHINFASVSKTNSIYAMNTNRSPTDCNIYFISPAQARRKARGHAAVGKRNFHRGAT